MVIRRDEQTFGSFGRASPKALPAARGIHQRFGTSKRSGIFRRNRWKRIVVWIISVLLPVTVIPIVFFSDIFVIRSIECREASLGCSPEVIAELERSIGQRMILLRPHNLEEKIRQSDSAIASVDFDIDVKKRILSASIAQRIPVVTVAATSPSDSFLAIDEEGIAFEAITKPDALPVIVWEGFPTLSAGQKVPDQLVHAVTVIHRLPAVVEILQQTHVRANVLEVTTTEGTVLTFSVDQDPVEELTALQLVLNQSRIDGVIYRSVDLRYDHPIVTK